MYHFRVRRFPKLSLLHGLLLLLIVIFVISSVVRCARSGGEGTEPAAAATVSPAMHVDKLAGQLSVTKPVSVRLFDHDNGQIVSMDLEEYICHVVAAEMPASYELEALKAQAVAVRTLAVAALMEGGRSCTAGSDLCTSGNHCQAYLSEAGCRARWGGEYDHWWARITLAVDQTRDQIIVYGGKPIEVFYHAVSGGETEDVSHVFALDVPYLRSVVSAGEEGSPNFERQVRYTRNEVVSLMNKTFAGTGIKAGQLEDQLLILSRYGTGRVETIQVGSKALTGRQFRGALGLPSTHFSISYDGDQVIFSCLGYGHGVGMSQTGANIMAGGGADYIEILTHYYTGVDIAAY